MTVSETMLMAYIANNTNNDLLTASWTDGLGWTGSRLVSGQPSKSAPALAVGPWVVYSALIAYVADNGSNDLLTTSLIDRGGDNEYSTGGRLVEGQSSNAAPALLAMPQQVILAYVANNDTNDLLTASSTDGGIHWTGSRLVEGQSTKAAPALAGLPWYLPDHLLLAYLANNDTNDLLTASSTDGIHWTGSRQVGQTSQAAPALTCWSNPYTGQQQFILAFVANNDSNQLLTAYSKDGINWTDNFLVDGESTKAAPALALTSRGNLVLGFVANDASNALRIATSTDGVNWTDSAVVEGQSSSTTPALYATGLVDG